MFYILTGMVRVSFVKSCLFVSCVVTVLFFLSINVFSADLDMRDLLHSWYKNTEQQGSLKNFPEGAVKGNLYESAYAMAQAQITHPALQALDLTYQVIADRCEGEDILSRDVTNVFAASAAGEQFYTMLDTREMVSTVKNAGFNKSCVAIYSCYNKDVLEHQRIDRKNLKYSTDIYRSCTSIVDTLFLIMYQRASSLETMKNPNYGDDFLVNANPDDGPYDLLLDIQAIGDVLFAHNDGPSEVHFYDMEPAPLYVTNDPDALTPFDTISPETIEQSHRFPVTAGVTPSIPKRIDGTFPPKQTPPSSGLAPVASGPSPQAPGEQTSASISNVSCDIQQPSGPQPPDTLQLATQENIQTEVYNKKIDLETSVAVLIASKMNQPEEEKLGIIPRGGFSAGDLDPQAQETADPIYNDVIDLAGDSLDATKNKIQACIEQFTNGDKHARGKILLKSLTQPAEFTKCVFGHLCKEIGDPSERGMYRIKMCKEVRRASGLVSNQSVKSVEEVVDEMLNVCTTLKESGALLEHNKTKDHLEDKMMRIDFGEKFSFGLSVIFQGSQDAVDPAVAKQTALQQREYLEQVQLGISDDLAFAQERDKYLVIESADAKGGYGGETLTTKTNQQKMLSNMSKVVGQEPVGQTDKVVKQLQKNATAGVIGQMQEFVLQNLEMWKTANQYTDSMNKRWKMLLDLYQGSNE